MSTFLAEALRYAAAGLPVLPLQPRGKTPAVARGFYAATTNGETIKRLWRIAENNIGIPTGALSGVWVLDIDGNDGEAAIHRLEAEHGPLPPTRMAITPRGGRRLWFKYTGPIPSAAGKVAPNIDTRGDGGYVVAVPPIGANGRAYEWVGDPARDLAIAPDWLVDLARKKQPTISECAVATIKRPSGSPNAYGRAALEREIAALAAAAPGGRNHVLNRVAFRLFQLVSGGELDHAEVIRRLIEACNHNGLINDDGERSVRATIRSAATAGLRFPRSRKKGRSMMNLRPYQTNIIAKFHDAVEAGHRWIILVAPTGSGKTVIGASIIDNLVHNNNIKTSVLVFGAPPGNHQLD